MHKTAVFILIGFSSCFSMMGQCCSGYANGSELVLNGDFTNGNSGFNTSYVFATTPGLGRYGITTDANDVHPQFWAHCKGHTTGTDNFMWVDLSGSSSVNIWTQNINNVVPGRYYLFSAWVNNLGDEGPGTIQFSINGKLVGRPLTASNTLCNWVKFCYLWYSGNNSFASITITNKSSGGSGNDMGMDDISFREFNQSIYYKNAIHACQGDSLKLPNGKKTGVTMTWYDTLKSYWGCDSIIGIPFIFHPTYDMKVSVNLCDGESYQLPNGKTVNKSGVFNDKLKSHFGCDSFITTTITAHEKLQHTFSFVDVSCYGRKDGEIKLTPLNGSQPYKYSLKNAGENATGLFNGLSAGEYDYLIKDANGCSADGVITLSQPDEIIISVYQSDYTVDLNSVVNLSATCNFPVASWLWKPSVFLSCDTCPVLTTRPDSNITYRLIVNAPVNAHLCTEDTVVTVRIKPFLYLPNAFSPNGDRLNDGFCLSGNYYESIESFKVEIFNSWGQKVFTGNNIDFVWDGNYQGLQSPVGVYAYFVKYAVKNKAGEIQLRGTISLLR